MLMFKDLNAFFKIFFMYIYIYIVYLTDDVLKGPKLNLCSMAWVVFQLEN